MLGHTWAGVSQKLKQPCTGLALGVCCWVLIVLRGMMEPQAYAHLSHPCRVPGAACDGDKGVWKAVAPDEL